MNQHTWDRLSPAEKEKARDNSDLAPSLQRFCGTDVRVEITWKHGGNFFGYGRYSDGKKGRGRIGRSTGWKPVYLLLLRSDSSGGMAVTEDEIESVRVI